jgi:lysyl-tRNA synthetase, class II
MDTEHRLIKERISKLKELESWGVDISPYRFDKKDSTKDVNEKFAKLKKEEYSEKSVSVSGRIIALRNMGKASFFHIQDNTGKIQIYIRRDDVKDQYKVFKKCDVGDFVGIEGEPFRTKTGELSIIAKKFTFLTKSFRPFPEKYHGLKDIEQRYRKRYVDFVVNPEAKEVFVKRSKIMKYIREFLDDQGFLEIQTPILQPLYGGGLARPFTTKINAWDMKMYLRIAYEIYLKQLIVGGFEKIYDLSSCFRNEGSDKTHNPEFTMMEIQWMYKDYNDGMDLTEKLWEYVAKKVNGTTKIKFGDNVIDVKAPWTRLRMVDAVKKYAGYDIENMSDDEVKAVLKKHDIKLKSYSKGYAISILFEELCEEKLIQPTHIIDHPVEICPLAKQSRNDKRYAERCESFVNTWEVSNLYSELTDPFLQRKNFEEQERLMKDGDDEAHPLDENYLEALEYGLPPNCGIGIGVDRMIMLLTEQESIRDIILFPTMRPVNTQNEKKVKETRIAVALINKGLKLKAWEEMNTVAHLNASFAARIGKSLFMQDEIVTKDDKHIKLNIQHAIMIKTANSNKELLKLLDIARDKGVKVSEFTREMIETTDDKKVVDWTKDKKQNEIDYLGILLFGKKSVVDQLTEEFDLYDSDIEIKTSSKKKSIKQGIGKLPTRADAQKLLVKHVKDDYQKLHAKMVATVLEKMSEKFKGDKDLWYITGLLHDLDFFEHPEQHPDVELELFEKLNYPTELIKAVAAHYFKKTKVMPESNLDKALLAVDELVGFLYAYSKMRPNGFEGMAAKSIKKKFKDKGFAAAIDREDIMHGIDGLNVDFGEHVNFVISVIGEMDEFKK